MFMKKIPLGRPYLNTDLILEEIKTVIDSRWISGGPTIKKFEESVKDWNGDVDGHYIAVSDGTCAIEMALRCLNNGNRFTDKDEIIVPSWSWVASGFAVIHAGATPVWCDVNEFGVPYAADIEKRITENTRAIILVHQMGIPCDMDAINEMAKRHNLPIIEDAACAFGSEYLGTKIGNSDNIVTFSLQARKCLTTGEGGLIVTRNSDQAEWLTSFRAFGTTISPLERDRATKLLKESFNKIGYNYKISDITAAVGLAQLKVFDEEIELRSRLGVNYDQLVLEKLNDVAELGNVVPDYCTRYNWQNYHIVLNPSIDRDTVVDRLRKRNIGCKWDIQAIHLEPVFNGEYDECDLPGTMIYHNHGLWLPFYAEMTFEDQEYVVDTLREIIDELR